MHSFDEKQMTELCEFYAKTKYLMLKAEELDPVESEAYLQPRLELYQAFDHLMTNYYDAIKNGVEVDLASAMKHVYTAFFDIADWLNMLIRKTIINELGRFDPDDIKTAIPDYYSRIRPELDQLSTDITKLRADKVLERAEEIEKYLQLLEQSFDHLFTVRKAFGVLIELKRKRFFKNPLIAYILAVLAIVVTIVVAVIIK